MQIPLLIWSLLHAYLTSLLALVDRDFAELLLSQRGRIVAAFGEEGLDELKDEFRELVSMYRKNQTMKEALDACSSTTSFEGGWGIKKKVKRII